MTYSVNNFSSRILQDYGLYSPELLPGMLSGTGHPQIFPYQNAANGKQKFTITVPGTVDNSGTYTLVFSSDNGEDQTISVTTSGSATTAELQGLILTAIRQNPVLFRWFTVVVTSATVLTLTVEGRVFPFTITCTTNGTTTNDITVTETVAASTGSLIKPGLFVATKTTYPAETAALPSANTDAIVGVTVHTHWLERDAVGLDAEAGYEYLMTMNVLRKTLGFKGIAVRCVEDLTLASTSLYVVASGANAGMLTTTSTSNIDVSSVVNVQKASTTTYGTKVALVSVAID